MKIPRQRLQDSYIIRFFAFLTHFVYNTLSAGFLGRIFTSYSASDKAFRASYAGRLVRSPERGGGRLYRAFRRSVALAMSRSVIVNGVSGLIRRFCQCSLRTIGLFLVTSGAYSSVMYWLFSVIWHHDAVGVLNLFCGIGMLILGILLLFSDASLGYALQQGVFFGKILMGVFGVSDDALDGVPKTGKQGYVIAVPLGMVLGAVCALISPFYLIAAALALLFFLLVLSIPEAGVMLLILFLPFAGFLPQSELWLVLLAGVPLISYLGKLLRGNRAFHMEVQDLPVLLMLIFFLLSGFSLAGGGAWRGALFSALFVGFYFLVVNVIATPRWMNRCRVALIVTATAASLLGIFQFVFAAVAAVEFSFAGVGAAVCAGFADRTTFAYFLVIAFPFILTAFVSAKKQYRLVVGFAMVSVIAATVLTWVQSAWIALLVILLVFLLLYERRTFPFVLVGGVLAPMAIAILPNGARSRFLGVLRADSGVAFARSANASHIAARIFFERGSGIFGAGAGFSRLMFGLGNGGIEQFCMLYTTMSPSALSHSFNFWLYRLLEGGILGVLLPAAFFFLLYQNCFSLMRATSGKSRQFSAITGIILVTGVLLLSFFRYAWYDPAALLIFFVATALIAADARYERARSTDMTDESVSQENAVEMEYYGKV